MNEYKKWTTGVLFGARLWTRERRAHVTPPAAPSTDHSQPRPDSSAYPLFFFFFFFFLGLSDVNYEVVWAAAAARLTRAHAVWLWEKKKKKTQLTLSSSAARWIIEDPVLHSSCMGFHHSAGGHSDFPLCAHHICNTRASAVERSLLEVTINQGRPTMRFMEEETESREEGREEKGMHG